MQSGKAGKLPSQMQMCMFTKQIIPTRKFKVQWKNKCELIWFIDTHTQTSGLKGTKIQYIKMILNGTAKVIEPYFKKTNYQCNHGS